MKKHILKSIARVTVFFRYNFDIGREARLSIIEYKNQKLINNYTDIDVSNPSN